MDNNKLKETRLKLVADNNYMSAFRQNIRLYDVPLRELSEVADVPFDTLKSFIYGDTQDCKLSMVVKLAKALGCSIDELVGANTMCQEQRNSIAMLGLMPPQYTKFVRWAIRNNYERRNTFPLNKALPIMQPTFDNNMQYTTNMVTTIVNVPDAVMLKTFLGIRIPCDDFIPHYYKDDIVFLANDRKPKQGEHIIVAYKEHFWIVIEDKGNHRTITDNRINNNAQYIGYICHVERKE